MVEALVSSTIKLSNPSPDVVRWIEEQLIIPNPDYAKKIRMGLSTYKTPRELYLFEKVGDTYILPFGCFDTIKSFPDVVMKYERSCGDKINYHGYVPLYDYQKKAKVLMTLNQRGILQAPAGSGKTQIGIAILIHFGYRALWITHTQDLLNQSKERAERYLDTDLIGTITAGKVNIGKGVTFATVQTLYRLDLSRYKDIWDVIIVDECHRVAGTPSQLTMFSKVLNSLSARYKFGLSATVHRADGLIRATYSLLGTVVYEIPKTEVADKVMPVGVRILKTETPISRKCLNTDGTLNYVGLINYLAEDEERNEQILCHILPEVNGGHSVLILSARLSQLHWFEEKLGDAAVMIDGKMTSKTGKEKRTKAIEDMRTGKKQVLLASYNLAKEGLDIPRLDRLFMATPQQDKAIVIQSLGRIARVAAGKINAICFDFVDVKIPHCRAEFTKRQRIYRKEGCYDF